MAHLRLEDGSQASFPFGLVDSMASPGTVTGADPLEPFPSPAVAGWITATFLRNGQLTDIRGRSPEFPVARETAGFTLAPGSGARGQLVHVTVNGVHTEFAAGLTRAFLDDPDLIGGPVTVTSPSSATFDIAIGHTAAPGPHAITLSTRQQVLKLRDRFTVTAAGGDAAGPTLASANPDNARIGDQNVTVTFTGQNTHWEQGKMLIWFIGGGVSANSITVTDPTHMTAALTIGPDARLGPQDIMIRKHGPVDASGQPVLEEVVRTYDRFTVNAAANSPGNTTGGPGTPGGVPPGPTGIAITEVTPASARPGDRAVPVTIKAKGTHFVQGASYIDFGELVGATSLTITSPTTALAKINIDPSAPAGSRTVSVTTPSPSGTTEVASLAAGFTVGTAPTRGRFRVAAVRLKVHQEEFDNRPRQHGRNNEIQFSNHVLEIDRRDGTKRPSANVDGPTRWTVVHGDINNARLTQTSWQKNARIQAGTYASSGGIQNGDEFSIWSTNGTFSLAVVPPDQYVPFIIWSGNLRQGTDAALLRPVVWLHTGEIGDINQFSGPIAARQEAEQNVDFLNLPALRNALGRSGVAPVFVPQLATTGQWSVDQRRPFGLKVSSSQTGTSATWTDLVLPLTFEKVDAWLANAQSRTLEVRFRGNWQGPNPVPMGDCSLTLMIQRIPENLPPGASQAATDDARQKMAAADQALRNAVMGITQ